MRKPVTRCYPPTAERAREVLDYDPDTGVFKFKSSPKGGRRPTHPSGVGGYDGYGYHRIGFDNTQYKGHSLAWLMVYGVWPKELDHINGVRDDNRISNLRECTRSENQMNRAVQVNNPTGLKGVSLIRLKCGEMKYRARLNLGKARYHLGCYDSPEEAHEAYVKAAVVHFGEFARV